MTKAEQTSFQTTDGLTLNALEWAVKDPIAHLSIVHGLGEHIGRYAHVASFYNTKGISVSGLDLRGHGLSEGPRGYAPSLDQLHKDLTAFIKNSKSNDAPKVLYGHSMGGNLVLSYLMNAKNPMDFKCCIATSPWIKLVEEPVVFLKLAAKVLNKFGGFTRPNELDTAAISSIEEEVEKYIADPLVHDKVSSVCALAIMNSGEDLINSKKKFPIPLLINHGTGDRITSHLGSQKFFDNQANEKIALKLWDDMYHELHNDREREALFKHCYEWIIEHI